MHGKTSNKMICQGCHKEFDFLYGEDTQDGGKQGCEDCFKPSPSLAATRPLTLDPNSINNLNEVSNV